MSWLAQQVDLYCERISPDFWAEPMNALTNISFIIAAYLLFSKLKSNHIQDMRLFWLVAWIFNIGLGSLAFHTLATRAASLLDILPISIFIVSYIAIFFHMVLGYRIRHITLPISLFFVLGYLCAFVPEGWQFNDTISYAPAFIFLIATSVIMHQLHGITYSRYMFCALVLFICSMTMRSVDMMWCASNPIGTHFLWHLLNGGVLYLSVIALYRYRTKA